MTRNERNQRNERHPIVLTERLFSKGVRNMSKWKRGIQVFDLTLTIGLAVAAVWIMVYMFVNDLFSFGIFSLLVIVLLSQIHSSWKQLKKMGELKKPLK